MLFTERKALEEMFSYMEQDKRTIKAQARQDIENIEARQMQLLDRLQRLDDIEREAVDVEGVLTQLAATTTELTQLIPHVPVGDVLERAAQLIAENPVNHDRIHINEEPVKSVMREKIVEAARIQQVNAPVKKPAAPKKQLGKTESKGISNAEGVHIITEILKGVEGKVKATVLKKRFEAKTGVVYANFHNKLYEWIKHGKGKLVKEGQYYYLKENEKHEQQPTGNETQEKAAI